MYDNDNNGPWWDGLERWEPRLLAAINFLCGTIQVYSLITGG